MLTPQEMREKKHFEKAVFGGYSVEEVDTYITTVTEDYSELYKENSVLKSQLKVVVDRLENYRKQEDSMNKAMIKAQQAADELVAETERKCARMLSDTEQLMRTRKHELQQELDEDRQHVQDAKAAAAEFISEVQLHFRQCQEQLDRIRSTITAEDGSPRSSRMDDAFSASAAVDGSASSASRDTAAISLEIDQNIGRILEQLAQTREQTEADGSDSGAGSAET